MKKFSELSIGFLALVMAVVLIVYRWMQTPNGRLHPYMAVINKINRLFARDLTLETLRSRRQQAAPPVLSPPPAQITDRTIDGPHGPVPLRIYTPFGRPPFPVVVFFHGGGFVQGSIRTHDHMAQRLAQSLGAVVVSVEYRLAPEYPFPAGHDDCYAAVCWAAQNCAALRGDSSRLIVAGDSAGGNLAATVALRARDEDGPALALQCLLYPVTLMFGDTFPSRRQFAGYILSEADMRTYHTWYLPHPNQKEHPYASPLLASDLSRLPPAYVMTAGMDPLRDQGKAYAERLHTAGVPVSYRNYEGMLHAFLAFDFLEKIPAAGRFFSAPSMVYAEIKALVDKLA